MYTAFYADFVPNYECYTVNNDFMHISVEIN